VTKYCPRKGDIVVLEFTPQAGHEQSGTRPGLVISEDAYNASTFFAVVCPITNQRKGWGFEVGVTGAEKTTGVVLSDQFKSLDYVSRKMRTVDSADKVTVDNVLLRISRMLGI